MKATLSVALLGWFLTACLSTPLALAQSVPYPIAARVVNARGQSSSEDAFGDVVGNIEVTTSNHQRQVWTVSLRCELPQVLQSGLVGWTYAAGRHSRGAWMNNELCVARNKNERIYIHAARAFIDRWAFTGNGTHVVVRSRNIHGPSWLERFRTDTGKLIDACSGSNYPEQTPEWARPYLDDQ